MIQTVVAQTVAADPTSLRLRVPGWPEHRPGQFAMLALEPSLAQRDPLLPRPMAVYRVNGLEVEFRFRIVGRGTLRMARLRPGDPVRVTGPLGNGFEPPEGRAVLVGGGTGVASLYELARDLGPRARVALGGRTQTDILGLADFEALDVELAVATEDGSAGHRGLVTALLKPEPGDTLYACGPTPMMAAVARLAADAGVPCQVSLESPMACGFGVCLGCVVPTRAGYRYVCTHGPVFDAAEIDWEQAP